VIEHAGRLLALVEADLPLELDRDLATIGPHDFGGAIAGPITAHPKRCPRTGELHVFGYQFEAPHLTKFVVDDRGRMIARRVIEVSGPSYLHDFALTEHHAVFFDTPARMIAPWGAGMPMPFRWDDDLPTRVVVVPRDSGRSIRRFEVAPCVLGHVANGYEDGDKLVVVGIHYARLDQPPPVLYRWELDLATGRATETPLDDRPVEFPRIDDRRTGEPNRYTYAVELRLVDGKPGGSLLRRHDARTGESRSWDLGASQMPGECVFVPAAGDAAEDAGWLLTFVYDAARDGSDLVVLDARDFGSPPVARVRIPQRVPFGFHGSWVPSTS
jgi:carotenoid cleavage dioxygenase